MVFCAGNNCDTLSSEGKCCNMFYFASNNDHLFPCAVYSPAKLGTTELSMTELRTTQLQKTQLRKGLDLE
jgi:uncharacterized protein YjbI with pentapeptide repeats